MRKQVNFTSASVGEDIGMKGWPVSKLSYAIASERAPAAILFCFAPKTLDVHPRQTGEPHNRSFLCILVAELLASSALRPLAAYRRVKLLYTCRTRFAEADTEKRR